ncbi:MAG TPA: adenylosuccinate lyase [Microbacteriaceae bacterium]|nr:adenylosuccinate lyase [Microbacteriaceae bacterium]
MNALPAQPLSPLDGRYRPVVEGLGVELSEAGLNRARLRVETEWLIYLTGHRMFGSTPLRADDQAALSRLATDFGPDDIAELAALEAETRHDVKAVEYFVRRRLAERGLESIAELTHFGATSEDINNIAYALTVREAVTTVWLPAFDTVVQALTERALAFRGDAMLAHTHGQPATPTTMGKELAVFVYRLRRIRGQIVASDYLAKFSGATGTFAADVAADPDVDWRQVSREFVGSFGLTWNPLTTQIEPHDWQAELYARLTHANRVLHNLATDLWTYISLGYFRQVPQAGATGSSTMPHKINPIRFENAEANLELSCAVLDSLSATLVTSRMQRDLTDSTTQRNIGVGLGHSLLALDNLRRGLDALDLDRERLAYDLDANWEVLGEAIQTVIRAEVVAGRSHIADPYALLKGLTRGKRIGRAELAAFLDGLEIGDAARERLRALTPARYIGLAESLVDELTTAPAL